MCVSQVFFYTADTTLLIRSITVAEMEFFLRIFPQYHRHLTRNTHTLLPRCVT